MATHDLALRARDLVRIHDAVLSGTAPPERPRAVVARSWERMLSLGIDPDGRNGREPLPPSAVDDRRRDSRLSLVIDEIRELLLSAADASNFLVVVTDADGVVLWRSGSSRVRRKADVLGFAEGATWTESAVGTNAIGTALAEAAPVQLFSAEHFENAQVPWYCSASPIHDPIDGSLLGIVDVSGPALTLHPAIEALVTASVRLAEARLWRHHEERLTQLRRSVEPLLSGVSSPLLVVDDHGWVAAHQGVAVQNRVEAPRADRVVAVPGLGLCLPERLRGGWLIRARASESVLTATLDLRTAPAVLEVRGPDSPWRVTLSPRHAEVLSALAAAGPSGVTAGALSQRLYGDSDHQVTVRAEISRMRRALGALLATSPYRLGDGVELTVLPAR
ncbi:MULTISPECIES: helix-turn-helix domain-containing protein [unclassified Nocardioides]|uniref:helix-turn-helix domain-containing protein n=1 Tax=unclassified Nocardioides TaxID=2615069 RepID=UPI0006F34B6A|nr:MULTISPECIES: helix-turn-helix domain-containing protein [unclassified Nocardioides]KQY64898.1 diguanylate cyclase [Nocardioides sp. Root140]KQZ67722.1 diguanylate cyclase [Nocardioides sp. Root151]